ncbi:MAG: Spo0E family sporulation regulatory protein-aspartic acid phosphatase [Clostridiaceae bacterium]|nr:Spo0E family sporulation regulatory protein-aspartic acid phosphatase [Clostridiaceae bacterium]
MSELKKVRKELHEVIETGSRKQIVEVSQELDKIILRHMYSQIGKKHL